MLGVGTSCLNIAFNIFLLFKFNDVALFSATYSATNFKENFECFLIFERKKKNYILD